MFKRKTWTEVSRRYTQSAGELKSVRSWGSGADDARDLLEEAMFGITTVELRCDQTGEIKFVKTIGKHLNDE